MGFFKKIYDSIVMWIGDIHWQEKNILTEYETGKIRDLLGPNYYIILTRRNNHLSTYFISLANFLLTGKMGYWGHAFMNLEGDVTSDTDFKIIEAINTGVQYTRFEYAFNVNGVALLRPKNMSADKWTVVLDRARTSLGIPYDTLFDLKSANKLSCVELVRYALQAEPDYAENFKHFEKMISERKNLTPQMFYECEDFEVVYEVRRS